MAVSYSKKQRDTAKAKSLHLVTIDVAGMTFQGPVSYEQRKKLEAYLHEFLEIRFGEKNQEEV